MSDKVENLILQSIADLKSEMKEGFCGIHKRQDKTEGNVRLNTENRLKNESFLKKLPDTIENLSNQFGALYKRTQAGYIKVRFRVKILWTIVGVVGLLFIDVLKDYILAKYQ